jgi:hypothetical protein
MVFPTDDRLQGGSAVQQKCLTAGTLTNAVDASTGIDGFHEILTRCSGSEETFATSRSDFDVNSEHERRTCES